ncbi:interferon gamma [Anolis carolinensis]|uniref:Interferon gamma n=1 Tax=Anolis carolinensis TaxID=28377 RepID=T1WHR9_ANOCA|nr:interferon gamma [Anolis carolinensis]
MAWQICLIILLAARSSLGLTSSTSERITSAIESLQKDFNATRSDVAEGGPVFTKMLDSGLWSQPNEKKILIAQIISKYVQMLNNITKTPAPQYIKELREALEDYKKNYNESLMKANDLIHLAQLPMDNLRTQRKAVLEMTRVLQEVKKEESRRRRRSQRQNPRGLKRRMPNMG